MRKRYLDESGVRALARLSRQGIFPSPYNFVANDPPSIDEYIVHDSTLREGEQTPGVVFSVEDKVRIAEKLDEVGIRQIEAGFPSASEKQSKCIKVLVRKDLDAKIFGFARAKREDIDSVSETGADGIVLSFSISQYHRKYKFRGMTRKEYLDKLTQSINYAEASGLFVVYSAEDSTREKDLGFLEKAFKTAEEAGADRVRIVDTLGCASPHGMAYLVREVKNVINVPAEVHCHNDMGLALANSLAAVEAGASTVSTSVNGLGERVGITSTEEFIFALRVLFEKNLFDTSRLNELSRLVEDISGMKMHMNKPVTGENACAHSSGIHQQGISANPTTYEFYTPELCGQKRKVCLDELCGRHGVLYVAEKELGMNVSEKVAKIVVSKIKSSYRKGRRSAYKPEELKKLIVEAQGAEVDGASDNGEHS